MYVIVYLLLGLPMFNNYEILIFSITFVDTVLHFLITFSHTIHTNQTLGPLTSPV